MDITVPLWLIYLLGGAAGIIVLVLAAFGLYGLIAFVQWLSNSNNWWG